MIKIEGQSCKTCEYCTYNIPKNKNYKAYCKLLKKEAEAIWCAKHKKKNEDGNPKKTFLQKIFRGGR